MAARPATGLRLGKYHLVERLGSGGMAEAWRAVISGPGGFERDLVVKRILPHMAQDRYFVEMFVDEATLLAQLHHPNIVQVFEFAEIGREFLLVLEYVDGADLYAILREQSRRGHLPAGFAAYVGREVARALAYAHALTDSTGHRFDLIHRDVTPSNVMIGRTGVVKLLDFGVAKAVARATEKSTQTGVLKGKFGYMSPEQVDGETLDGRTDIFSLGIVMHELLTGRRMFRGDSDQETINLVRKAEILPPSVYNPMVPPELDAICMRALARDREERYSGGLELIADLEPVVFQLGFRQEDAAHLLRELFPESSRSQAPVTATVGPEGQTADGTGELTPRPRRKSSIFVRTGVAAAVVAVGAVMWVSSRNNVPAPIAGTGPTVSPSPSPSSVARIETGLPTPTLDPVVAAPREIELKVLSTPIGADIFIDSEPTPRGKTPMTLHMPRGSAQRSLTIRLAGHKAETQSFSTERDAELNLRLTPKRRAVTETTPDNSHAIEKGVVDPFNQ